MLIFSIFSGIFYFLIMQHSLILHALKMGMPDLITSSLKIIINNIQVLFLFSYFRESMYFMNAQLILKNARAIRENTF